MSYLVIRALHIWAVSILLGGTALTAVILFTSRKNGLESAGNDGRKIVRIAEWIFWPLLGIIVFTGAGNLGSFGDGLPDRTTAWGQTFLLKLGSIGILFLLSLFRLLTVLKRDPLLSSGTRSSSPCLTGWYGATAVVLTVATVIAVRLAHG